MSPLDGKDACSPEKENIDSDICVVLTLLSKEVEMATTYLLSSS